MEVKDFTPEEQEKIMMKYSQLAFANLKKNIIQDLINNRNESIIFNRFSKEQIVKMLDYPQRSEKEIRELSGFIYLVSSHYRRLIDYYSTILLYNYTVVPTKIPITKPKKNDYKKAFYHVINQCDKYHLRDEAAKAIKIAVRDGVYFGLCFESEDSFYIKPFDNRYAKISSIDDGVFRFSIDMAYFSGKEYLLDMYGSEFKTAYRRWKGDAQKGIKGDKTKKWYEPENGICLKIDESDPFYSLPLFTGVLLSVLDIEDYKLLQKAKAENDNYKVLSAKMETDDNGVPKMDYNVAKKYYEQMAQNLPGGIGLLLSPFDVEDFSFKSSASTDNRNAVTDAESQFWEAAGVSSLLFGSTKATTSAALILSVKPDEALAFSVLQQFERFFNRKIKKMNLDYSFKLVFLQQSIFNVDEYVNRFSKATQYGVPAKMYYASSLGLSPSDIIGMSYLEDEILELATKTWTHPLISSNTQSSISEVGRPTNASKGEGLSESGEQTKESDQNANR